MTALKILEEWELGQYSIHFHWVFITSASIPAFPVKLYIAVSQVSMCWNQGQLLYMAPLPCFLWWMSRNKASSDKQGAEDLFLVVAMQACSISFTVINLGELSSQRVFHFFFF